MTCAQLIVCKDGCARTRRYDAYRLGHRRECRIWSRRAVVALHLDKLDGEEYASGLLLADSA